MVGSRHQRKPGAIYDWASFRTMLICTFSAVLLWGMVFFILRIIF